MNLFKFLKSLLKPALALLFIAQAQGVISKSKSTIEQFDLNSYQVFVNNWDDKSLPILCVNIKTEADWNRHISPAAVMGKHKPYQPEKKFFDHYQLILVSKISSNPDSLRLVKAEVKSSTLRVEYTEKAGESGSALFKANLMLQTKQSTPFKTIEIFEKSSQGKLTRVCQIN